MKLHVALRGPKSRDFRDLQAMGGRIKKNTRAEYFIRRTICDSDRSDSDVFEPRGKFS
jgi:hypothetical protein